MKTMIAKYPGHCTDCGKPIEPGQTIKFFGRGKAAHQHCFAPNGEERIQDRRAPCWICGAEDGKFRQMGAATPVWCDDCYADQGVRGEDEAAGLEPGTLANDRRLARRGLSVTRFSFGAVHTQNSRGRCEDAPCCGCCT